MDHRLGSVIVLIAFILLCALGLVLRHRETMEEEKTKRHNYSECIKYAMDADKCAERKK